MNALEELVKIPAGNAVIEGALVLPENTKGLVLFAHGSGSSRHSPRNNYVARVLNNCGLGTLLMDLLTSEEDRTYETRFDISLLTRRLTVASDWVRQQPAAHDLPLGYFGASTGAAAAIKAAAADPAIRAVVSRGGRPDLAKGDLSQVTTPVLLIVGGEDHGVIELNEEAYAKINGPKELAIVPEATHLFEEPGTLEEAALLAAQWFDTHL